MPQAPLVPGPDGSPVPDESRLIRMANEPKVAHLSPEAVRRLDLGMALPSFFDLSTEDKNQPVPRLSVWVEGFTSVAQAWVLVGASPTRRWVVRLDAAAVRRIAAPTVDSLPSTPPLEVHWERATTLNQAGERIPETRPGHEGHAGIAHLDQGNKTQRTSLRMQLADASAVEVLTPERLAAIASPTALDPRQPVTETS